MCSVSIIFVVDDYVEDRGSRERDVILVLVLVKLDVSYYKASMQDRCIRYADMSAISFFSKTRDAAHSRVRTNNLLTQTCEAVITASQRAEVQWNGARPRWVFERKLLRQLGGLPSFW